MPATSGSRPSGISADNLRLYEQPKEELAHYAKRTVDIQYRFFPEREEEERQWDELMGIANRTDFDLADAFEEAGRRGRKAPESGFDRRPVLFRRADQGAFLSLCDRTGGRCESHRAVSLDGRLFGKDE